jgi:hypothetical protein
MNVVSRKEIDLFLDERRRKRTGEERSSGASPEIAKLDINGEEEDDIDV